jgi:hypothetical protein
MIPLRATLLLLLILGLSASALNAQAPVGGRGRIEGRAKFMPIPYINYDRSFGLSVGAVPLLMLNPNVKDTISPSSIVGGVGTYSTNKTWFAMGFGKFFLAEDKWRIAAAGGIGNVNFQFYLDAPVGTWIPYSSEADFFILQVERRIWGDLYGGVSYVHANVISSAEDFPVADTLVLNGLGLNLSLDRTSNPHYPREGYVSNIKFNSFPEFMGNEEESHKLELEHNHYFSFRGDKDVLAARAYAGLGLGDVSFSQQIVVGRTDIRGYTQGAFRGDQMLALQGEYRWNFLKRWGAVGFAGMATVFNAINESDNGKILPGAGAGIRFKAFQETNFSVGLDAAVGIDDWGIYFQVGEAF